MTETGEVIGTQGKLAFVRFTRNSACGNCTACGMTKNDKEVIIEVTNNADVKKGDWVEIEFNTNKALASSAIAYVFPLSMLIIGIAAGYILSGMGIIKADREIVSALLGIGLTIGAYILLKVLDPMIKKRMNHTYKIVDKK